MFTGMDSTTDEIRPAEAAKILNVSRATVDRWANDGTLHPVRISPKGHRRYSRHEVQALKADMGRAAK